MKRIWIEEQQAKYTVENIKKQALRDILDAAAFLAEDDPESAFRLAGGAAEVLYRNQEKLK